MKSGGGPQTTADQAWLAPQGAVVPDFVICGAMKSGTTTLHRMLVQHPKVFIPDHEVFFFDLDDPFQHPDFASFNGKDWFWQDIQQSPKAFWAWYARQFAGARPGQLIGEDSTTYLPSQRAFQRIALQEKPVRIIVMLRHPTDRAYSQYWHMLRSGRSIWSFEDTIRYHPESVLSRSMYGEQLSRMQQYIAPENVRVLIFEQFIRDQTNFLNRVCEWLNLDPAQLPEDALGKHANRALVPQRPTLQHLWNRWSRQTAGGKYAEKLPVPWSVGPQSLLQRAAARVYNRVNPSVHRKPPPMLPETRKYLDEMFRRELSEIDDLVGQPVLAEWFK